MAAQQPSSISNSYLNNIVMASERCAGCFGTGRGPNGGYCSFCSGTGSIWVPDKPKNYGPVGGRPQGRGSSGSGGSFADGVFEDNLAGWVFLAIWGLCLYYGLGSETMTWHWPVFGGLALGYVGYWLMKGPLRFIGTLIKYLLYLGLIVGAVYCIYEAVKLFTGSG